ncbi:MAG TPA: HAD family hydrolase [Roseiflexaceae bacterium]|nr:HAD family hydrolase [Roseiflexaceae bacterium]
MKHRAVFLDRDGTLVHARHYPSRPEELLLYDGIGAGLRRLQAAGWKLIVITNQAGIARGYFDESALTRMHDHLRAELARAGVQLTAIYHCPHHPEGVVPGLAVHCECRKPEPGMLPRAAREHALDLHRSWFVGDILDDVEAGNRAGCRSILVDLGTEHRPATALRTPAHVARDTAHALELIAAAERLGPPTEDDYLPAAWLPAREVAL